MKTKANNSVKSKDGVAEIDHKRKVKKVQKKTVGTEKKQWLLRLYIAGQTPKSLAAFQNLKKICDEYLKGEYKIEVIDLLKHPHFAKGDQIVAIPTLVRSLPAPVKKIIGDLSNYDQVLAGLDIKERKCINE